jgi:prepilin-type N-terminal cleavage/methylation domain-containing protein
MNQDGFSMIELLIIMIIISVIIAVSTMSFQSMNTKSNIETEFKRMYSDLLGVRSQALFRKTDRAVTITSTGYSIYASADTTANPQTTTNFKFPVTVPANMTITFDQMGFATFSNSSSTVCVCAQTNASKAFYNSLIVSPARIQIGNLIGTGCTSANINPQ